MQATRDVFVMRVWGVRIMLCPWLVVGLCVLVELTACGGGGGEGGGGGQGGVSTPPSTTQSGTVTVSISDPPTCKAPRGELNRVWVTITLVRAHLSNAAGPNDGGWVTLLDLGANPQQIDLLATSDTTCVLTTLGSTTGLPPGDYQQIRLHLLSNTPAASEVTPVRNNCAPPAGPGGFNCVELMNGPPRLLQLSSEVQTGIKIPPGQIAGGAIRLQSNQAADINIDFDACASIVQQGNGAFRLKPTLHAGEISTTQAINGRVVDNSTGQPIPNATVMAEQPDASGIDRVILQTLASATDGTFILCPLSADNYDIVIAASTTRVTYNATITFRVPAGTALGTVSLVPEVGSNTSPGTIDGLVTTTANGVATGADVTLSALQTATPAGGIPVQVTIPLFVGSTSNVATGSGSGCPQGTGCANYLLSVPASNPRVGTFSPSGTAYASPAGGSVTYSVNAQAFIPGTAGETPDCPPSSLLIGPVTVSPVTITQVPLAFTGCAVGF